MTDNDLNRVVQEKHSLEEMQRLLGLEHSDYHIMENGSVETIVYRFSAGPRYLFLDACQSNNIVTRAFFVDSLPESPHLATNGPNGEVVKPR